MKSKTIRLYPSPTGASIRSSLLAALAAVLAGCAASNPVLKQAEWNALKRKPEGAVIFSLPQTRFSLTYQLVAKRFKAGPHTSTLDHCAISADRSLLDLCARLKVLGIVKPLRLSDPDKNFTADQFCRADGGPKESRVTLAEGSVLSLSAVPDAGEVYVVPLRRSYFQSFDFALELNENGTVGKGSLSTENLGADDALALIVDIGKKVVAAAIAGAVGTPPTPPARPDYKATRPAPPDASDINAASMVVEDLEKAMARRDLLAAEDKDERLASRAVLIATLDARIASLKELFVGKTSELPPATHTFVWIPAKGDEKHFAAEVPFDACGEKRAERPQNILVTLKTLDAGVAPMASGSMKHTDLPNAKGWPYRVPQEAMIAWAQCGSLSQETSLLGGSDWLEVSEAVCSTIDGKRALVSQLGETFRLPEQTGGKKSVIAPEYYADGSLKKLTIAHTGTSPAPLIGVARGALLPPAPPAPPTETANLTAQAQLIAARQALCRLVFNVAEGVDPCVGENPPTAREE